MSEFYNNAIFWVEVEKIKPNPYQPRKEFDQAKLEDLAKSIRQYGVIQPLTVTRKEYEKSDGGLATEYELIAGERRLRASRLAGIQQVPVIIRADYDDDKTKLEVAIIENLQREDLNPMDRAQAFARLVNEFGFKHVQVAEKVGKSREYVSNTLRLLALPQDIQAALTEGKITEGHARPLLMLVDRPQEQNVLFREILLKRLTVRDTESIARRIALDRVRKKEYLYTPEILQMERELTEALGTRVAIEPKENGGKLSIDFMGEDDLRVLFSQLAARIAEGAIKPSQKPSLEKVLGSPEAPLGEGASSQTFSQEVSTAASSTTVIDAGVGAEGGAPQADGPRIEQIPSKESVYPTPAADTEVIVDSMNEGPVDDRSKEEKEKDENTFDPSTFSL